MRSRDDRNRDSRIGWSLLLIILIGLALRAFRLDHQSMWYDEAISRWVGTWPLDEVVRFAFVDRVHPPLYFLMLDVWQRVGDSVYLARFFSLGWGVLVIPMTYWLGRRVAGRRAAGLAAALVALSPFDVWYSQEIRMYTLVTVFVLAATGFLLRSLRRNRTIDWIGYSVFVVLSAYTHHVTLFMFLPHAIVVVLNVRRWRTIFRRWALAVAVAVVLYLPWLIPVALDGGFSRTATGWILPPTAADLGFTAYAFAVGMTTDWSLTWTWLPLAVWSVGWVMALRNSRDREWRLSQTLLVWMILVPLALVWVLSLRKPFYVTRYFAPLQPAAAILACAGWAAVARARRVWFLLAASVVAAIYGVALFNMYFVPRYFRQDWRAAAQYLCPQLQTADRVIMSRETINQRILLDYYCARTIGVEPVPGPDSLDGGGSAFDAELKRVLSGSKRAWLVVSVASAPLTNLHGFNWLDLDRAAPMMAFDAFKLEVDRRLTKVTERVFPGVLLVLYEVPSD